MKKQSIYYILFCLFVQLLSIFSITTQTTKLIDPEGQWNIYQPYPFSPFENNPFSSQRIEATAIYFFDGDTIINDNLYHKIYQTAQPTVDRQGFRNQYVGALKEAGQQVYWIRQNESAEILLYDYDLTVGDTMWVERFDIDVVENVQIILESIDSIQTLDQQTRRRFNFSIYNPAFDMMPQYFTSWIEGIGDIGEEGFLETHIDGQVFTGFFDIFNGEDYISFIQCFSKADQLVYQNENSDVCFTLPDYTPLVIENATWVMYRGEDDFTVNTYWANKILGDTIIERIPYKKLYYYDCYRSEDLEAFNLTLMAVLREDINQRKVYGRFLNVNLPNLDYFCEGTGEHLLFDFAKTTNQNFEDCHAESMEESTIIQKDGIEYLAQQPRRVLQNDGNVKLIEGIGYNDGLFLQPTSLVHAGHGYGLLGYIQDANFGCELLVSTNEPLPQKVTIFPNPTANLINLQLAQPLRATIALKTLTGQTVYQANFNGGSYQISVSDLSKGIYLLYLQSKEGYLMQKIIIQ